MMKNNKASILVICLWTIMILSILGLGLTGLVFQEIRFAKTYQRLITSLPIAKAAIKSVFYLRKNDATLNYDTLQELSEEKEVILCDGNSYKYAFVDKMKVDNSEEIIDEGALININTASKDVLMRLPGLNESLADSIVNSGKRPFSSINELLLVDDMTPEIFIKLKDCVTVYGTGKININTVSKPVLLALGLDEQVASQIVRLQKENKIVSLDPNSTGDLGYGFSSTANILDLLRNSTSLGLRQEQDFLSLLSMLDVKSEYLRFNVTSFSGGKEGLHYSIVIDPATKKILSWKEQ